MKKTTAQKRAAKRPIAGYEPHKVNLMIAIIAVLSLVLLAVFGMS